MSPELAPELEIEQPNQVWCADITYIRMRRGFAYLVAVMDWFSRYVLSWRLSNTLDAAFCMDALDEALEAGATYGSFGNYTGLYTGTCRELDDFTGA